VYKIQHVISCLQKICKRNERFLGVTKCNTFIDESLATFMLHFVTNPLQVKRSKCSFISPLECLLMVLKRHICSIARLWASSFMHNCIPLHIIRVKQLNSGSWATQTLSTFGLLSQTQNFMIVNIIKKHRISICSTLQPWESFSGYHTHITDDVLVLHFI